MYENFHHTKITRYTVYLFIGIHIGMIKGERDVGIYCVSYMYAESNMTFCICHKLGICTLTNPSVGDVIFIQWNLQVTNQLVQEVFFIGGLYHNYKVTLPQMCFEIDEYTCMYM